ncbi:UNVERIFIED_CONTAM: GNAT superfamily N-acetyltransferase [Paenibacillus sp. PvR008]
MKLQVGMVMESILQKYCIVGFGRDLMVDPDYQNKGMGQAILNQLLEKCKSSGIRWGQLSSAKNKQNFYKKFGFQERPADTPLEQGFM